MIFIRLACSNDNGTDAFGRLALELPASTSASVASAIWGEGFGRARNKHKSMNMTRAVDMPTIERVGTMNPNDRSTAAYKGGRVLSLKAFCRCASEQEAPNPRLSRPLHASFT